ncbi:MAG: ABC transporter substrate-binding protein [Chloroflexi bacterium]|nr:ABC transporter substrate-binding protein [Chloroflexota bacterium]
MIKGWSKLMILVVPGLLLLALLACARAAPTATPTRAPAAAPTATPTRVVTPTPAVRVPTGTLNLGLIGFGSDIWLVSHSSGEEKQAMWAVMADRLLDYDLATGSKLVNDTGLAESWRLDVTGGSPTVTFKLRKGIPFHKGYGELTSEDLKFTLETIVVPDAVNPYANSLRGIVGDKVQYVETPDPYTVVIKPTKPVAGMEAVFGPRGALYAVISKKAWDAAGGREGFRNNPVGTGSFEFVEEARNQRLTFKAQKTHWRQVPGFETLIIQNVPEEATRIAMIRSGQLDIAAMSARFKNEVAAASGTRVVTTPFGGEVFVIFGGQFLPSRETYGAKPPYNSPWVGLDEKAKLVRKAMNLSMDREVIISKILFGEGRKVGVPHLFDVPGAPWYNANWKPYPYDPAQAKKDLAQAGYPNGFPIKASLLSLPYGPSTADIMEAVAGSWEKELGLKVERQLFEYRPVWRQKLADRSHSGWAYAFTQPQYQEPYLYMQCCFQSKGVVVHWEFEWVDQKFAEIEKAFDPDLRFKLTREVGDWLYDNYISMPMASLNALWAVGPRIAQGWGPTPGITTVNRLEYLPPPTR